MSNWKFLCINCGKQTIGEGLGHCPDRCSSPDKAHAERLQAAKSEVDAAASRMSHLFSGWDEVDAISRLIDAKVELALLERGGS